VWAIYTVTVLKQYLKVPKQNISETVFVTAPTDTATLANALGSLKTM
jgi:hypothetical protein